MPLVFLCSFGIGQRKLATHIYAASVKQILCVLIIDKLYVLLHAAKRKEGDGGGRPTTGEEEALPKANAICRRGVAEGREPDIVWADVSLPGQPQLVNTLATSPEVLASSCLRGLISHFRGRREGMSSLLRAQESKV